MSLIRTFGKRVTALLKRGPVTAQPGPDAAEDPALIDRATSLLNREGLLVWGDAELTRWIVPLRCLLQHVTARLEPLERIFKLARAEYRTWICAPLLLCAVPVAIGAELLYSLQSPLVGGSNAALYQIESGRVSAVRQKEAKAAADVLARKNTEQQALNNSPAARFASTLQSQMFLSVSQQLSQRISSLQPGQAGTFQSGDIFVTYTRTAGMVEVQISTPGGTTLMQLPVVN